VGCGLETEEAVLLEASTGHPHQTLTGHKGSVLSVAFSAESQLFATGSADGTARLWEAAGGRLVEIIGEQRQAVTSVAFSPPSKQRTAPWFATASQDSVVRLWSFAVSP
jgi:WD40 repeat protein